MLYAEFDAPIAAGATLDELNRWYNGGYERAFKAHVLAWYKMQSLIRAHEQDAVSQAIKRRAKKK